MAAHPRTILVTGASSGIGLACARAFLEVGDRVVAQYRTQADPVEKLAEEYGARVLPAQADLATEEGCVQAVATAGAPQVLVHSAGIWNEGPIHALDHDLLEEMFRTNTFSAYYLARETARVMAAGLNVSKLWI